jgi:RNA polymerase sigma-70 factor (ECF subfamily)
MGVKPFIFLGDGSIWPNETRRDRAGALGWIGGRSQRRQGRTPMVTPGGQLSGGSRADVDILPRVYDELRRVAARLMRKERPDHTLSPTAVVHEAVIRLLGDQNFQASDCDLLMASASRAMREVLIEHARHRAALRRGGVWRRVALDLVADHLVDQNVDVAALHEALDRLARLSPRQSQVITLRYFAGLTVPEVADALGVSVVTVERDWRVGRAWLRGQFR